MRPHNPSTTKCPSTTNLIGAYGPLLGLVSQKAARRIYCVTSPIPLPLPRVLAVITTRTRLFANFAIFRTRFCIMSRVLAIIYDKHPPLRQLCYVSPRILRHKPGSCYYLRQAPASSLNIAMFRWGFCIKKNRVLGFLHFFSFKKINLFLFKNYKNPRTQPFLAQKP